MASAAGAGGQTALRREPHGSTAAGGRWDWAPQGFRVWERERALAQGQRAVGRQAWLGLRPPAGLQKTACYLETIPGRKKRICSLTGCVTLITTL